MRAALLDERIHILELQKTVSKDTGAEERRYVKTHRIKAHRKKLSASVGDGLNAREEFIGNTVIFQVRKYSFLNEDMRIKYGSNVFKVVSLDKQRDNTYLITCSKVND